MLTEPEAEKAYKELLEIIREVGLGHVAHEVVAEVNLGKTAAKKVKVEDYEKSEDYLLSVPSPKRRTKTETFTETVAFTAHEKLRILIAAVERATIELSSMLASITEVLVHGRLMDREHLFDGKISVEFAGEGRNNLSLSDPVKRTKFAGLCLALSPLIDELKDHSYAPAK